MRVAITNQKGGVGKTTTAVNLAASLAARGHRVLIVDLDPQGNATTGLGIDHRTLDASVYEVLMGQVDGVSVIVSTDVPNLDVLPASIDLAGAELELVSAFARETKLRSALDGLSSEYAVTLIDCPPSLGLLTVNGLTAADCVLVPIQCEYYALEGLSQLVRNVDLVRSGLNRELTIGAIVLTMYDARTKLSDQVADEVRRHFGEKVFKNVVPRSIRLSEAPSYGQPAVVMDPASRGSMAYRWVAEEFEARFRLVSRPSASESTHDTPGATSSGPVEARSAPIDEPRDPHAHRSDLEANPAGVMPDGRGAAPDAASTSPEPQMSPLAQMNDRPETASAETTMQVRTEEGDA